MSKNTNKKQDEMTPAERRAANKKARAEYRKQRKEMRTDSEYWDQPLILRIYLRVLYAGLAFISTVMVFSLYTRWGDIPTLFFAGMVSLAVLVFRVAFPNGFNGLWDWTYEAMYEAAKEAEMNGEEPSMSSDELKKTLLARGEDAGKISDIDKRLKAEQKEKEREAKQKQSSGKKRK